MFYFLKQNNQESGPFEGCEITAMHERLEITDETLIRMESSRKFIAYSTLFNSAESQLPTTTQDTPNPSTDPETVSKMEFVAQLRHTSVYPAFRQLVNLMYFFIIIIGVAVALLPLLPLVAGDMTAITLFKEHKEQAVAAAGLFGMLDMAFFLFIATLFKEISSMLVDMFDCKIDESYRCRLR